jgi:hypothetical protein
MAIHFSADEQEPTATRSICIVCRKSAIPVLEMREGPICRPCKSLGTEMRFEIVIHGRTYTQDLLKPLAAVESQKAKTAVRPAAFRKAGS